MERGGFKEGGAEEEEGEALKNLEILSSFYDEEILWLCKSLGGHKDCLSIVVAAHARLALPAHSISLSARPEVSNLCSPKQPTYATFTAQVFTKKNNWGAHSWDKRHSATSKAAR